MTGGEVDSTRNVIRVFVEEKLPLDVIDHRERFPKTIGKIRLDVQPLCIQGGTDDAAAFDTSTMDVQSEIRPGISVGNLDGPPGTLGLIATANGKPCFVSADHVFAPLGEKAILI
jgi:hypothetical protein